MQPCWTLGLWDPCVFVSPLEVSLWLAGGVGQVGFVQGLPLGATLKKSKQKRGVGFLMLMETCRGAPTRDIWIQLHKRHP